MVIYTVWFVVYLYEKGFFFVKGVVQCEKQEKILVEGVKLKEFKDGVNLYIGQIFLFGKVVQVIYINICSRGVELIKEKNVEKSLVLKFEFTFREKK